MGDIKNPKTQIDRVFFDEAKDSVFMGGGKDDAASIVGQEFADITGGTGIRADEIDDILSAILTSKGWSDSPGLEGVELVSLTTSGFTIGVDGAGGSTDFFDFSGPEAEAAVAALDGSLDIKNNKSQFAVFDTDTESSIWIGGGKSNARDSVGQEFADITGGSRIDAGEAGELLAAVVSGSGWNDPADHGLEGVELVSLTENEFALTWQAAGPTEDTMLVTGAAAEQAIADAAGGLVDIKNNKTQLGIFDVEEKSNFFLGGGASDKKIVSDEFAEIVDDSKLHRDKVLEIFDALTSGGSWNNPGSNGLDGVELVGLTDTSFTVALDANGPSTDYIIFTNVDTLDGAADFGFVSSETPEAV